MDQKKPITKEQLKAATKAMAIRAKINELQNDLNNTMDLLLEFSNQESYTVPVPGQGQVQIVGATEAGTPLGEFNYIFNKDKFLEMTETMRRKLAREGVVTLLEKLSSARKASIRIVFNK